MKKHSRMFLLFCLLLLWHNRTVCADDTDVRIMVNQQEKELMWKPMLFENDVMIALEDFGRILEADVVWDETGQRFAIGYNDCILMEDIANETEVVWNDDGETCFPLQGIKKCFYLKKQGQFFVSIRSFSTLLGIEYRYDETDQVVYLTCSSTGENKVTPDDVLCMDMQRYVWKNQENQFDTASEDIQEFYDQRTQWVDAAAMGLSDIWSGIQDLLSGMTNAENIIKDSLETLLSSLPENDIVAVNHELYDFLKDAEMGAKTTMDELLEIENEMLEIVPNLKPLKESIKNLDDTIGDVSLLYDVTAASIDAVAVLLSNYEKNIGYLDVLESALQENNQLDPALENSITVLRMEYTNKFIKIFFKTRDDLAKFSVTSAADIFTGGIFSVGEFAWKAFFGAIGINGKGEALKLYYGLYCVNGSLDIAYKNQYRTVQELVGNQEETEKLRQLDDLQRAIKKNMYQCMRIVTDNKDTQEYCEIKEKEYSKSCLSWNKVVYITESRSEEEIEDATEIGMTDVTAGGTIFEELPETFIFASGVGAWSTRLSIDSDGVFLGNYTDTDMGAFGEGYPNGTEYFCDFNGKFAVPQKIGEYSYRMPVEYLHTETENGFIYYENGIRYIASDPYGMENAQEIFLYMPGCPMEQISEEAVSWIDCIYSLRDVEELPSECYVLYNEEEGTAFLGQKAAGGTEPLQCKQRYEVYDMPLKWEQAKDYCEDLGGHLAVITSPQEKKMIDEMVGEVGEMAAYWLGGKKNSNTNAFEWITGESFDYTNWAEGEPNDYLGRGEDCLQLLPEAGWNDMTQNGDSTGITLNKIGFICEWDGETGIKDQVLTKQEVQTLLNDYFNAKSDGSVRYEVCDEIEEDSEGCYQFTLRSSLTKEAAQELIEAGGQPTPNKLIDSLSVNVQTGQVEMGEETFQLW